MAARLLAACSVFAFLIATIVAPVGAQNSGTRIAGTIVDQAGGIPVAGAAVDLYQNDAKVASTTTDGNGSFSFDNEPPGTYYVRIAAQGYQETRSDSFGVIGNESQVNVNTVLSRSQLSNGQLREIGRVSTSSNRAALQTTTTITRDLNPELIRKEGNLRIADGLMGLPGVNTPGQSSSVGDDIKVDIRGLGASETQALLDGHPIGPIGVFPVGVSGYTNNGGGLNYNVVPTFGLRNTQVTFGSGAVGLYGIDAIGGTVDFQTLVPTATPQFIVEQGVGMDQGRLYTMFQTTGQAGKLGYAASYGVQGTYGNFQPAQTTQFGANPTLGGGAPDLTAATIAGLTYNVTGNYLVRQMLAKLSYDLSPATRLTFSAYNTNSIDDKTGEGDNDFVSFPRAQFNIQQSGLIGASPGCPTGVVVATDANPTACFTPNQAAQAFTGPAGGGPGAYQDLKVQDYSARLTTSWGKHTLGFNWFVDNYGADKVRPQSFLNGATASASTGVYNTVGYVIGDDWAVGNNDLGFGFSNTQQTVTGNQFATTGFLALPTVQTNDAAGFVRDVYTFGPRVTGFFNAWYHHVTDTGTNSFDPRLSIVYRPTGADVIRVTGGKATGFPAPEIIFGGTTFTPPGSLNPSSNCSFSIGSVPNQKLAPETATDMEVALGHRFFGDTTLQAVFYNTNVINQIFAGQVPVTNFPGALSPAQLSGYFTRAAGLGCPSAQLTFSSALNAATARARGIEISGRARFFPHAFIDFAYDVQSTVRNDIPNSVLSTGSNVNIINGAQVNQIPIHKAWLGLDVSNTWGLEARIDAYWIGDNNALNRPGYIYANAAFTQAMSKTTQLNFGVINIFNGHSDIYGRIGQGIFQAENQFGTDTSPVSQGSEAFGLPPATLTVSVSQRL